jgi:tetratricopeptide (TPR) repeat protein
VIERARLLYQSGRIRGAQDVLLEALKANPQDALARAFLAMCYKVQGRYGDCERELKQALADGPNEGYAHYVRTALLVAQRRYHQAITAAREAIGLDATFMSSYVLMATAYIELGMWESALEPLREALAIKPESVEALSSYAQVLRRLNRLEEARTAIESALRVDPLHARAHANRGWILMDEGRYDDALAAFREALRADPYVSEGRQGLVEALKATNKFYRGLRNAAPVAAAATLVPAVFALFSTRLSILHLAFYGLVFFSYAVVIVILIDAFATVATLKKRFGRASIPSDLRSFATVAGCCLALTWFCLMLWLGNAGNSPLYAAVVIGSFGLLSGAAFAVRPSGLRVGLALYILVFCGSAIIVPIGLHDGGTFRFSNAEDALAAAVIVIVATWLSLGGIAWLRRRV